MRTILPGILSVGIFDRSFRSYDTSVTHLQEPPESFRYVDNCADPSLVDVVLATEGVGLPRGLRKHPRHALFLQESAELARTNAHQMEFERILLDLPLVLTNRRDLIEQLPNAKWLPPIGTWIRDEPMPEKTKSVSFLAKSHGETALSGYRMRDLVRSKLNSYDSFGTLFGKPTVARKEDVLLPYRFHIAIENSSYDWYTTEKLWDAFATKTVPLYWGCPDLTPVENLGFDLIGVSHWSELAHLEESLHVIGKHGEEIYGQLLPAVEANYALARELYCTEVLLERILRETFELE